MKLRNVPFSPPDMTEEEAAEVREAILSGWITTGPRTKQLEKVVAAFVHTNKAVCLNSATAAMELTLRVLGVGEGDEVIVPAYTYTATASAAVHAGATIKMVDIQKGHYEMDYDKLAEAITEKTKVVVPVDYAGVVCDYDKIFAVVESKKNLFHAANEIQKAFGRVIVMADCAHAYGSQWHGKMAGGIADFSCFSFHAVKNFTTAEGGAATWISRPGLDDEAIYKQYQLLSLHGQNKDALAKTKLGAWEYDIIGTWYKCNMTDIHAALGLVQQKRYPEMLAKRRAMIEKYDAALKPLGVQVLNHYGDDHAGSGHLYIVRLTGKSMEYRNEFITKMAEMGVACNVHYKPLPMMTAYKALGFDIANYPNAYDYFHNEVTLPLNTRMTMEDVEYVIECFTEIWKNG
jgi:dTDP-4-amino-4,6-dideoxygalactose transaminase